MPLSYAAGKLREATEKMTDEYIRSAVDFIGTQKHLDSLSCRNNLHIPGQPPLYGNPNLSIGCWIGVPFYAIDFGWGKPVYVGPAVLNTDGKSFIIPTPADDGSLTIVVCFQTQYLDSFKRFFYEDMIKKPLICYTEEAFSETRRFVVAARL